ncbi:hypothetical protein Tco_0936343 [Tanacetum coccineum]
MIDELSIVETDKVIHTVETDKVKQIVDVESSGKSANEIDKEIVSFAGRGVQKTYLVLTLEIAPVNPCKDSLSLCSSK